jgi:hypothetical protein
MQKLYPMRALTPIHLSQHLAELLQELQPNSSGKDRPSECFDALLYLN